MNPINKSIKINPFLIISLLLLGILIFLITNRILFMAKNVNKVLGESRITPQNQKVFNIEQFENLKKQLPIQ